ncbi:MAG: CPBP family intramembrane metalloprotease [Planctomycetaceae bacterium]|nr:CPBP family intramembrane metalloprotease [Planctomycetaceae bacterium]
MHSLLLTFAQAAGELPELSTGQQLTALAVMSAFGGSLLVYSLWAARWHQGRALIPAAARKPHYVPPVLLAIGMLLMGMLIVSSLVAGEEQASEMVELSKKTASGETERASEAPDGGAPDRGASDADSSVVTQADSSPPDVSTDAPSEVEATADPEQKLTRLMLDLLTFDVVLLLVFGGFVFMARGPSRQVHDLEDIAIDSPHSVSVRSARAATGDQTANVSTEGAIPFTMAPSAGSLPADQPVAEPIDAEDDLSPQPLEPWNPVTEFRYAVEAVLAAYLPTVLLRVILLSGQEEPTSHPLLEVMENGVSPTIMAMVFGLAVIAAPVVEELMFRVVLCGGLIQRRLLWPGIVVSSVMFSMSHGYPDSVALLPLAVVLGYVYARRRSYRTVILVHFLFNAFNMGIALVQMIGPSPAQGL